MPNQQLQTMVCFYSIACPMDNDIVAIKNLDLDFNKVELRWNFQYCIEAITVK